MEVRIKRKTMTLIKGSTRLQKAVSIAVFLKFKIDRSSIIRNYTPYKVQKLTGISPHTLKKYLPLMLELGLVSFCGKNNEHLVISRLHSKIENRNIDLGTFAFQSFREVYQSIRSYLFLLLQHRKEYVRRTLQIARYPKKGENFKAARKAVKRLVKQGVLKSPNEEPKEYGISLKRIGEEVGVCLRTAEEVVKFALIRKWCRKFTHFKATHMPGVNRMEVPGYMFTTLNYGFNVTANTYVLSPTASLSLGMVF